MKWHERLLIICYILAMATWAIAADYSESKKIDGLADVTAVDTTSTKIPAQDMNDTDKIGYTTIQSIQDIIESAFVATADITIGLATPSLIIDDTDGADGIISVDATDANDAVMTLGVDDSGGDDQVYIELDGVNERIEFKDEIQVQEQPAGTAIVDTTVLGTLDFYGDDDTASADEVGARIQSIATGTWTDGAEDAKLVLQAANDGTLNANQLVLNTDGSISSTGAITTTANGITLGDTSAGDPVITFDSGNDGTITWEEDGQDFEFNGDIESTGSVTATDADGAALDRETSSQAFAAGETQTTVTAAHMLANKWITDQGGSAETDIILTAVSYYIDCIIVETEGNGWEVCPPSGEALYLSGVAIAVDDCIDGGGSVGDSANLRRQQIADASWAYFLTPIIGTWIDGNDTGD